MSNKITFESLMQRAEQRKNDKIKTKEVYNKMLDGNLVIKRIPLTKIVDLLDVLDGENVKLNDCVELYKELIYKCCPVLQSKELQEEFGCAEPYDIVTEVFEDNVGEISAVAQEILAMYGMAEGKELIKEVEEEIKN
jgi:hypothetical protein